MFTIRVPATIANMGPGFDSFGMAVSLHNRFHFAQAEQDALVFASDSVADTAALKDEVPQNNALFMAIERLYDRAGQQRSPLRITVETDIPVTRGLGSSSTAVIAGLVGANRLLGNRFSGGELLEAAIEVEGHPDNVAPALLGGVVLYDTRPYLLPWPDDWRIITLSPAYPVRTEDARRILPTQIPLRDGIFNLRKAGVLTYALLRADADAFRDSLDDRLHQPYRRPLIPEYDCIERHAMASGAFGVIISGSGSTLAVFCPEARHKSIYNALHDLTVLEEMNMTIHALTVDRQGAVFSE